MPFRFLDQSLHRGDWLHLFEILLYNRRNIFNRGEVRAVARIHALLPGPQESGESPFLSFPEVMS